MKFLGTLPFKPNIDYNPLRCVLTRAVYRQRDISVHTNATNLPTQGAVPTRTMVIIL